MTYKVRYEDRSDYLFVHLEGDESLSDALQFWKDLVQNADAKKYKAVLVVDHVTGMLNPVEARMFGREAAQLSKGMTIAYVDSKEETFDINMSAEKIASNRGLNSRMFKNEEEAMEWLHWMIKGI